MWRTKNVKAKLRRIHAANRTWPIRVEVGIVHLVKKKKKITCLVWFDPFASCCMLRLSVIHSLIHSFIIIIIIITYIYNALNDALSASRIHNKLKTILSKYIHIQNRQS